MANTITIELKVDDKGTATIKGFTDSATKDMKKVEDAGKSTGAGLANSFSGMSSVVQSAKENWMGLAAGAVAAFAAFSQAVSYMDIGAKAMQIESSFDIMAEAAGINGEKMIASMKEATKNTIDDSDLMSKAVKLMLNDYNPDQIVEFSKLAVTASQYAGINVSEAFELMNDAIANKTPKALVKLGAMTKDQMKVVQEAVKNGADSMSLYELSIANLTLKQLQLQGTQNEATLALQRYHAEVGELQETLGKYLIVVMGGVMKSFQLTASVAMGLVAGFAGVGSEMKSMAATAIELVSGQSDYTKSLRKSAEAGQQWSKDMAGASQDLADRVTNLGEHQIKVEQKASKESIAAAKETVAAKLAALKKISEDAKANEKAAEAAARKLEAMEDALTQELQKTIADRKKYEGSFYDWKAAEIEAGLNKYSEAGVSEVRIAALRKEKLINVNKEIFDTYKKSLKSWEEDTKKKHDDMMADEEKNAADVKKRAEDQRASMRNLYKDLEQYSGNYYAVEKDLIEDQAENYRNILIDEKTSVQDAAKFEVAIATWKNNELKKLDIEKGKSSNDFFAGLKAGIDEIELKQTKWGKVGYETFKGMSSGMATAFSTIFEDSYKGKLQSIGDYSTMIWDKTRTAFFNAAAQMASEKIILFMEANWTDNGKTALSIVDKLLGYAGQVSDLWGTAQSKSDGGKIPGNARFPGDHPGNDTVPIWASPGEVVVRRSSVNSKTEDMLNYIQVYGAIPAMYNGGVVNTITNEPGRGYWGFSDFVAVVTGGISKVLENPAEFISQNLDASRLSPQVGWVNENVGGAISRYIEPVAKVLSYVTQAVGAAAAIYMGPVGAAAWAAANVYAKQLAESSGQNTNPTNAAIAGTMAAASSYLAELNAQTLAGDRALDVLGAPETYAREAGGTGSGALSTWTSGELSTVNASLFEQAVMKDLAKVVGKAALSGILDVSKGPGGAVNSMASMNFAMMGGDADGTSKILSELFGAMPKSQIISADTGIDFIPRDGVLVSTHKKEAILNADAADQWRSGRGSGDVSELLGELKKLNASIEKTGFFLVDNSQRSVRILSKWDKIGLPPETVQ